MTEAQPRLRDLLVADYERLCRSLTLRLKSKDSASEVLHETFLRLDRLNSDVQVQSPKDYIFRAAINIAKNRHKAENGRATAAQVEAVLEIRDEAPDPARIVEARSEIEALKRVLRELPARRREILNAISIEGIPPREVAARLQVSLRTVEMDLKQALEHCAERLGYKLTRRAGGPRPRC